MPELLPFDLPQKIDHSDVQCGIDLCAAHEVIYEGGISVCSVRPLTSREYAIIKEKVDVTWAEYPSYALKRDAMITIPSFPLKIYVLSKKIIHDYECVNRGKNRRIEGFYARGTGRVYISFNSLRKYNHYLEHEIVHYLNNSVSRREISYKKDESLAYGFEALLVKKWRK